MAGCGACGWSAGVKKKRVWGEEYICEKRGAEFDSDAQCTNVQPAWICVMDHYTNVPCFLSRYKPGTLYRYFNTAFQKKSKGCGCGFFRP